MESILKHPVSQTHSPPTHALSLFLSLSLSLSLSLTRTQPLLITSVVGYPQAAVVKGLAYIYVEAFKEVHVKEVCLCACVRVCVRACVFEKTCSELKTHAHAHTHTRG
jgi:hypothetical protein